MFSPSRACSSRFADERTGSLFSYVDLEARVPAKHPLRVIRRFVNDVLAALDGEFAKIHADSGRPSIPPERLLRALVLQAFYTIRSETQLIEQLQYNLLYRWFVGLSVDEPVWVPTVFRKNRERLLEAKGAHKFLAELLNHKEVRGLQTAKASPTPGPRPRGTETHQSRPLLYPVPSLSQLIALAWSALTQRREIDSRSSDRS